MVSYRSKYTITAELLGNEGGLLLDIGGRDRILSRYLTSVGYLSPNSNGEGHDFMVDLSAPRTSLRDCQFDVVVALDVLEHVDDIHHALAEILRTTGKKLVIALPNLATLTHRLSFLLRGRLPTDKYDLKRERPADRHRWLTTYSQIGDFVISNAERNGFPVVCVVEETEGPRWWRLLAWLILKMPIPRPVRSLLVGRLVFLLERKWVEQ